MQKVYALILQVIFLVILGADLLAGDASVEYRSDIIDYDDTEKKFLRQKLSLDFNENSNGHFSRVSTIDDENYFTWGLKLSSSENMSICYLGTFTAHFGTGLFLGRKNYFSPDPFSRGYTSSIKKIFNPSRSGNPLYSFQGLFLGGSFEAGDFMFSMNAFHSERKRYIADSCDGSEKIITSGVRYRFLKDDKYRVPVYLSDTAFLLGIERNESLLFQVYSLYSRIRSESDDSCEWSPSGSVDYSLKGYGCGGFSLQYRDSFIYLFFESGLAYKNSVSDRAEEKVYDSYGAAGGLKFSSKFFNGSFTAKKTGDRYLGLYSAGPVYPEDSVYIDTDIRLLRNYKFKACSSMNRAKGYSLSGKEYKFSRKELVGLEINKGQCGLSSNIRWINSNNGYSLSKRLQSKNSIKYSFDKIIYVRTGGVYQKNFYHNAWYAFIDGCAGFPELFKLKSYFGYCSAASENSVFIRPAGRRSVSSGFFLQEEAFIASLFIAVRMKGFLLEAGGCSIFNRRCFLKNRIELFSSYSF